MPKPELSPQDYLARSQTRAAWLSAVGALLSIPLSLIALYQSHLARVESEREELAVSFNRYIGDYPTTFRDWSGGPLIPGTIETLWEVLIANNGDRPISIVAYNVKALAPEGPIFYSGLDLGILDSDLNPEPLPLNLAPGTSEKLFVRIGTVLGQNAYGHLKKFGVGAKPLTLRFVEKELAGHGLDLFDNRATPMRDAGSVVGWRIEPSPKHQPEVVLTLQTARGLTLSRTALWYDLLGALTRSGT